MSEQETAAAAAAFIAAQQAAAAAEQQAAAAVHQAQQVAAAAAHQAQQVADFVAQNVPAAAPPAPTDHVNVTFMSQFLTMMQPFFANVAALASRSPDSPAPPDP